MSIMATLFVLPHGRQEPLEITDIDETDELWFVENNAKISAETLLTGDHVVYADVGVKDVEGEPVEAIEFARGRTCRETMNALRLMAEQMLKEAQ